MKLTEKDFIQRIAESAEVSNATAARVWGATVDCFIDLYCDGNELTVKNLGTFRLRRRKSRIGYDFKTGEKNVYIDGGASPFFKASDNLKKATDANYKERLEMGAALLGEE
jgi:nucleoid DNA-binding protein